MKKLLLLFAFVFLFSCGEGPFENEDPTIDLSGLSVPLASFSAYSSMSDFSGAQTAFLGYYVINIIDSFSLIALSGWNSDSPSTYVYDDGEVSYTIEWTRTDSTWCWTYYDGTDISGSSTAFRICITDTGTNFSIEIRELIEDYIFLDGSIAYNGSSGNVSLYDPPTEEFVVSWLTTRSGYTITVGYYSEGTYLSRLVMNLIGDGSSGTWEYYDPPNNPQPDIGSWGF